MVVYITYSSFTYGDSKQTAEVVHEAPIEKPEFIDGSSIGFSMEPTIMNTQPIRYSTKIVPRAGDVIAFKCFKRGCSDNENSKGIKTSYLIKRISAINGTCYTVLGDNPSKSFDSRNYGDLCGSDIEILGVVVSPDTTKK